MEESEPIPVSESLKVLDYRTIYKSTKWWSAVTLIDSFGRKQIAVYLWTKKDGAWKRKQKFIVHAQNEWKQLKDAISALLGQLPEKGQRESRADDSE